MKKSDAAKRTVVYERILLIVLLVIPFALIQWEFDNDIWFLLTHGRYVLTHGFPTVEPFTLHEGFSFVMQQWLSAVIFWFLYSHFGKAGVLLLVVGCAVLTSFLIYRICRILSDGQKWISAIVTSVVSVVMILFFEVTRPQIFTYLIVLTETLCLEKYQREGRPAFLFALPALFVLQSNMHAAMLFMPAAVYTAYFAGSVLRIDFSDLRRTRFRFDKKTGLLLAAGILSAIVSFLNPYGKDAVFYLFRSTNPMIDVNVGEMNPPNVRDFPGILFFVCLLLIVSVYLYLFATGKRDRIRTRFVFLLAGTVLLALMSQKSMAYFMLFAFAPTACCLRDGELRLRLTIKNRQTDILYAVSSVLLAVCVPLAFLAGAARFNGSRDFFPYRNALDFLHERVAAEEIALYTGYNEGGYAEFLGFRPYLDARAEVFLKKTNETKDVFGEQVDLTVGKLYYKDFINAYGFRYLLVTNDSLLDVYLSRDADFEVSYQDEAYAIYHKK